MRSVIKSAKTVDIAVEEGLKELGAKREDAVIEIIEQSSRGLFGLIGSKDAVVKVSIEDNFKEELLKDLRLPYVSKDESPERMKKKAPVVKKAAPVVMKEVEEVTEPEVEEKSVEAAEEAVEAAQVEAPVVVEPVKEPVVEAPVVEAKKPMEKEKPVRREPAPPKERQEDLPMQEVAVEGNPSAKLLTAMIDSMGLTSTLHARQRGHILYLSAKQIPEDKAGLVIGRRGETLDAMQYLLTLSANRKNLDYSKVILDINDYREKREDALKQLAHRSAEKVKKTNKNMKLEPMNPYERRIIHAELQKVEGIHTVSEGNEPYRRIVIRVNRNK